MAEDLVLYTNPMSRGAIARWMLEETGRPYRAEVLGYGEPMKTPQYLALNPMGKVPTLVHGARVVTEAAAICAYLAEAAPEADLAPKGLDEQAAYYRWLFFAAGPLESAITNKSLGFIPPQEREAMVGYGALDRVLDALDGWLADRPYVVGDRFTAADVYVGAQLWWGLQFNSIDPRPSFQPYVDRVTAREAHKRAGAIDDALIAEAQTAQAAGGQ